MACSNLHVASQLSLKQSVAMYPRLGPWVYAGSGVQNSTKEPAYLFSLLSDGTAAVMADANTLAVKSRGEGAVHGSDARFSVAIEDTT